MGLSSLFLVGTGLLAACGDDGDGQGGSGPGGSGGEPTTGGMGGMGGTGGTGGTSAGGGEGGSGGGEGGMGGGCVNSLPNETTAPAVLSDTGLYSDIGNKTIAAGILSYAPQFELWSDAAEKSRWVYLPECGVIDNTDEDDWDFPVGTRMYKEFALAGQRLETRLIHRYGPGPDDFLFATYVWDDLETEATLAENGVEDVLGTEHDVPATTACGRCHGPHPAKGGLPSRYLGFSAIQLSHAGSDVTMATLSNDGHLMVPNAAGYTVPGTPVEQAALGYLHANCATCHNDSPDGLIFPPLDMRLRAADTDATQTAAYLDLVNQPKGNFSGPCTHLIAGQDVANSCVHFRMSERGDDVTPNLNQMPPLATDVVDASGLSIMEAWIAALPPVP